MGISWLSVLTLVFGWLYNGIDYAIKSQHWELIMYSTATPSRNSIVPSLTNTSPNSAANLNTQIQALIDRLEYNKNLVNQIAEKQSLLIQQYQATGASTIAPLLEQIQEETAALNLQNVALTSRLNTIIPNLDIAESTLATLTTNANTIEGKGNIRKIDINYQRNDPDLSAIAALAIVNNTVLRTNESSVLGLVAPPNFGALPPSIYQARWAPAIGQNSGFTSGQSNTWITLPMSPIYTGSGFDSSGSRAIVTAGTYEIFAQVCGVGCVEFMCRIVQFVGAAVTLVCNGNTAHTVLSGGSLGSSWTVKSYVKNTVVLPACELELQYKFKTPHSTAPLSGGMPVSTPGMPEDFAALKLVRLA